MHTRYFHQTKCQDRNAYLNKRFSTSQRLFACLTICSITLNSTKSYSSVSHICFSSIFTVEIQSVRVIKQFRDLWERTRGNWSNLVEMFELSSVSSFPVVMICTVIIFVSVSSDRCTLITSIVSTLSFVRAFILLW